MMFGKAITIFSNGPEVDDWKNCSWQKQFWFQLFFQSGSKWFLIIVFDETIRQTIFALPQRLGFDSRRIGDKNQYKTLFFELDGFQIGGTLIFRTLEKVKTLKQKRNRKMKLFKIYFLGFTRKWTFLSCHPFNFVPK